MDRSYSERLAQYSVIAFFARKKLLVRSFFGCFQKLIPADTHIADLDVPSVTGPTTLTIGIISVCWHAETTVETTIGIRVIVVVVVIIRITDTGISGFIIPALTGPITGSGCCVVSVGWETRTRIGRTTTLILSDATGRRTVSIIIADTGIIRRVVIIP